MFSDSKSFTFLINFGNSFVFESKCFISTGAPYPILGRLGFPDFRSQEKTFQLITQVSGRAGRSDKKGMVYIQTFNPEMSCIKQASKSDYIGFYAEEIAMRESACYPPFVRMVSIRMEGTDLKNVEILSFTLADHINKYIDSHKIEDVEILGPVEAPLSRIKNKYRWHLIIKSHSIIKLRTIIKEIVNNQFFDPKREKNVKVKIDVDPYNML